MRHVISLNRFVADPAHAWQLGGMRGALVEVCECEEEKKTRRRSGRAVSL